MPNLDGMQIKDKIISLLRIKGPSLPVHIASATGMSILFSGAFLSELISDKKIKISEMRVGSSPVYFLPGQENLLDRYSQHLKSKERDAYELLKSKKFLQDKSQHPAIRVALRAIKDFAFPLEKNTELYWRFHTAPESEFQGEDQGVVSEKEQIAITNTIANNQIEEKEERRTLTFNTFDGKKEEVSGGKLEIFEKSQEKELKHKKHIKKTSKKTAKKSSKKEEGFFNKVKELLSRKGIEILDILDIKTGEITLKVNNQRQEELLIAYNKKKISEKDILKAYKKSQEADLPYTILSLGEAPKKTQNLLEAAKNLKGIEKL